MPGGWMERVKKSGGNITNGFWGERVPGEVETAMVEEEPAEEICLVNKDVKKEITLADLKAHDGEDTPWFVLKGEVYDGTAFLEGHPGGAASIFGVAGMDATEEFMAIRKSTPPLRRQCCIRTRDTDSVWDKPTIDSENAKAMMPKYHIGTLDAASAKALADGEPQDETTATGPRDTFLQSKVWTKATLSDKRRISADTKIFSFDLEHDDQRVGLPVGQHLMMRLRDPRSGDAIIRAYTPISEGTDRGKLHVLVKIYYDTPGRKGGQMTQALDSVTLGHSVDFKGPVGKFEYLGRGLCTVAGRERRVRRFVMICGGSGVTPIFQVFRAVMRDEGDETFCLVLDGNRVEEDILCKEELDSMAAENAHKCRILYTLTRPDASWGGLKGRMNRELYEKEVGRRPELGDDARDGQDLILVCGPPAMEASVKQIFLRELGWKEDDLLFF